MEKLSLGGLCLLDDHVKVIANRCKKLTELDLFGTRDVTNKSVAYVVEKLPELVKLDISLTKIDIFAIIKLKSLSSLKILNCEHLNIQATNDEIELIKEFLPNVTILIDMGTTVTLNIALPSASIEGKDGFWDIAAKQID